MDWNQSTMYEQRVRFILEVQQRNLSTTMGHSTGLMDLPRIGGRLSACVFSLLPRAFGVRSFRCAGGAGE